MLEVLTAYPPLFIAGAAVFGLLIGSFLNVVILRLPARMEFDWACQCRELLELKSDDKDATPPGLVKPPSACPACGHRIRAWENIPVLSYLFLRGKCSSCGTHISLRYPLVELITGVLFVVVAWHFGPTLQGLAGLGLTATLVALAGIDYDHQLLPDNITLPLLWAGLLLNLWHTFATPVDAILGAAFGYGVLWFVFHAFKLLTGKEGMGYGDFKLMGALGAWFGWQALPVLVVLSSVVGAVLGILMLVIDRNRRGKPVPFGPFIALAGFVYLVWGEPIIAAYFRFAGLPQPI